MMSSAILSPQSASLSPRSASPASDESVRLAYAAPRRAEPCHIAALRERLRSYGLRPTRQRMALGMILFGRGDRHVTADMIFEEARASRAALSLATVYNTLRQFTEAGLLRPLATGSAQGWFDTNTGDHHHFLVEGEETVFDIPGSELALAAPPSAPDGFEMVGCDVIVRLRRKPAGAGA
jgi:Fur family iron response transcriptional regulator